jgi:hypothetical protein
MSTLFAAVKVGDSLQQDERSSALGSTAIRPEGI